VGKQEVLCLEISVAYSLEVQVLHRLGDLGKDVSGSGLVKTTLFINTVKQFSSLAQAA